MDGWGGSRAMNCRAVGIWYLMNTQLAFGFDGPLRTELRS